jgi:phage baseplate assembly protein W
LKRVVDTPAGRLVARRKRGTRMQRIMDLPHQATIHGDLGNGSGRTVTRHLAKCKRLNEKVNPLPTP